MKPYENQRSKREQIEAMFDNIAPVYDRLNTIMSFGIDSFWRRAAVKRVKKNGAVRILDLATGTGDLAILMAKKIPRAKITAGDISEKMIEFGRVKALEAGCGDRITFMRQRLNI